jgi:monofunctional biosynthetic peptidoglycan transglycosylase
MSNIRFQLAAILAVNLILPSIAMSDASKSSTDHLTLIEFQEAEKLDDWVIINDGVMGGLSRSEILFSENNTAVFQGVVSLENNGGFSSTRTTSRNYGLDGYSGILLKVKGDGKKYQFRIRTDDRFDGVSYRYHFTTEAGKWMTIRVPFEECVPVFRGRVLDDVETISAKQIQQLGLLISDKQKGPFKIEVKWIKAYR